MTVPSPAWLGRDEGAWCRIRRCLVLAPHPDDFDVVAVSLRRLRDAGAELWLEVLTSGASGVDDDFAATWQDKAEAREAEQRASCRLFGLPDEHLRFHRLAEDPAGHMAEHEANAASVRRMLERADADAVVLPHGNDSNADHRRTFRMFDHWAHGRPRPLLAMLVRDPKTLAMRLDLITPFAAAEAEWKARMLRCHASQHSRNLRTRGLGIDERILAVNRAIADEAGLPDGFAEGFELVRYGPAA